MTNVRSTRSLEIEIGPGVTVVAGPNGAGKTTVLEAIVLALQGTLLRPGGVADLITQGEDYLRVEVDLDQEGGTVVTAAVAYSRDGQRRLTADGAALDNWERWREVVPIRTFLPDDLRLVKGSPRRRREYLDTLAESREPEYRGTLDQYEEALAQRNALLRNRSVRPPGSEFNPWEEILAYTGLAISRWRAATLASFIAPVQRLHSELTGAPPDSLRLIYRTNVAGMDQEEYRGRLAAMREADQQRTYTHLGPHRDDLRIIRGGIDVRECASQGEQRAAVLTLVLAEWRYLCDAAHKPLLLLDDVMSELDAGRRSALVGLVRQGGQVVITTTDLRYFTADELKECAVVHTGAEAR